MTKHYGELLAQIKLADQAIRLARLGADRERRWGRIRLLGERRYGELLGPAEVGSNQHREGAVTRGHGSTDDDRKQRERARQVAAVPEREFTEYVEAAESSDARGAGVPSKTLKSGLSTPVALSPSARKGLVLVRHG